MSNIKLNSDQTMALEKLMSWIKSSDRFFLLEGYAGTGKTFTIKEFMKKLSGTGIKAVMTAFTNKAVKILSDNPIPNVDYQTLHSLFKLYPARDSKGEVSFKQKNSRSFKLRHSLLIVDECSMISDDIFKFISLVGPSVKVLFLGDFCQIPPVNQSISAVEKYKDDGKFKYYAALSIIERQIDNPIIDVSIKIRNNLDSKTPYGEPKTHLNDVKQGLVYFSKRESSKFDDMLLKAFKSKAYFTDPNYAKVLSYTNASVNKYNAAIRQVMFGPELERIMNGDNLICDNTYPNISKGSLVTILSNFKVTKDVEINAKRYSFKILRCLSLDEDGKLNQLEILRQSSMPLFGTVLEQFKTICLSKRSDKYWELYDTYLNMFFNYSYAYAQTCHKSQGSTYENVFFLEKSLNSCKTYPERNQILYTSYTRPSKRLLIQL